LYALLKKFSTSHTFFHILLSKHDNIQTRNSRQFRFLYLVKHEALIEAGKPAFFKRNPQLFLTPLGVENNEKLERSQTI